QTGGIGELCGATRRGKAKTATTSRRSRESRGRAVALLDLPAQERTRLRRGSVRQALDAAGGLGQRIVLDHVAKPARIVAATQMIEPRLVVDAVGSLRAPGK